MFQTVFKGSNYNLAISLTVENSEEPRIDIIHNNIRCDQNNFDRLDELYKTISKFSAKYLECLHGGNDSPDFDRLQNHLNDNIPNVAFRTKPWQYEDSSEEISSLRLRIEQLTEEKEELIAKHKNELSIEMKDFDRRVKDIANMNYARLIAVKKELGDKYKSEISDLRTALEKRKSNYLSTSSVIIPMCKTITTTSVTKRLQTKSQSALGEVTLVRRAKKKNSSENDHEDDQHFENDVNSVPVEVHLCNRCGNKFKTELQLKNHRVQTHERKQKRYKCPSCYLIFSNYRYVELHTVTVHGKAFKEIEKS